ncbi:MAG: segregation/condensation protein A [Deltaproteobacteria bacterium]|nr:segregation/condensation protein A [Deltaproteobacteria bacterium]
MSYSVKLQAFEGPLDLLLHLIKKAEIDIYDIPIADITRQYLDYIEIMKTLNLDVAGEFLVMAATLLHIKSRMLLPVSEEAEQEEEDPRADLVKQLLEYQNIKEAAFYLDKRDMLERDVFVRRAFPEESDAEEQQQGVDLEGVTLFDLIEAFKKVIADLPEEAAHEVFAERVSMSDKISFILEKISSEDNISFYDLLKGARGRQDVIVTFLAILELMKLKMIKAHQAQACGPIWVYKAVNEEAVVSDQ